jgi:hypothetical protein
MYIVGVETLEVQGELPRFKQQALLIYLIRDLLGQLVVIPSLANLTSTSHYLIAKQGTYDVHNLEHRAHNHSSYNHTMYLPTSIPELKSDRKLIRWRFGVIGFGI